MRPLIILASLSALISYSSLTRIVVINDVHLNASYSGECNPGSNCNDIAMYGLDSPEALFRTVVDDMAETYNKENKKIDVVFYQGDFVIHGLSSQNKNQSNWQQMKPLFETQINYIKEKFPSVQIIPTIGNNDVMYYYEVPGNSADKQLYYGDLYKLFFLNVTKNSQSNQLSAINNTYMEGGYYRYDINSNISVLSMNTIYFNLKNKQDLQGGDKQLQWLKDQLESCKQTTKFIIQMHIYPGLFYLTGVQSFWQDNFTDSFVSILNQYQSKIIMVSGSHIHFADLRVPQSSNFTDMDVFLSITPSVSPIFSNNPGYTVFDINSQKHQISSFQWRFFQLSKYINEHEKKFITVDPQKLYKIDLNKPSTIKRLDSMMKTNPGLFGLYQASKVGYNTEVQFLSTMLTGVPEMLVSQDFQLKSVCSKIWFKEADYQNCISEKLFLNGN